MKSESITSGVRMKFHFFLFLFTILFLVNHSYSQTTNKGRKVTITYKNINYGIIGRVHKKKLVEGEEFVLFTQNNNYYSNSVKDTILSGVYHTSENGNSLINGVWKKGNGYSNEKMLIKGTFVVSNNHNGKGINTDRKQTNNFSIGIKDISYSYAILRDQNKAITLEKQTDNNYHISIRSSGFTLETTISFNIEHHSSLTYFDDLILNSNNIKLTYTNGDIFIGSVQYRSKAYDRKFTPDSGIYKYKTGEICDGKFHYQPDFNQIIILEGKTTFSDGSIGMNKWMDEFDLSYNAQYNIRITRKSLTEMRNMAKSIWEEKEKKLQKEKNAKHKEEERKKITEQKRRKTLTNKFGNYWGELVYNNEFTLGMTKEMIKDFTFEDFYKIRFENFYKISKVFRYGNSIEIWKSDAQKIALEILKGGEDEAMKLLALGVAESMGLVNFDSNFPTLVFTNGKLTEINQI